MAVLEIRLRASTLLIVGRPGEIPDAIVRAGDRARLRYELERLPADRAALGDLRRQWRRLLPGIAPATMTNLELVAQLKRMVRARTLSAALLYDNSTEVQSVDLAQLRQRVVHLPCAEGTLLVGPPNAFPVAQRRPGDDAQSAAILIRLARTPGGLDALARNWALLMPGQGGAAANPAALARQVTEAIKSGRLAAPLLAGPAGNHAATTRSDAPRPVASWSPAEKIGEAIARSRHHLTGEVLAMVEQLIDPLNLAAMAAIALVLAGVQFLGPAGAAIDTAIMLLAWSVAGYQGVKGVIAFVEATARVMNARTSKDIDECAKAYAHAFVAIGVALLARMLARAKMRRPRPREAPPKKSAPPKSSDAAAEGTSKPAATPTKKQSLRDRYLGRTPGKSSRTGGEVIERMRTEGKIDTDLAGNTRFKASDGNWYPLDEADMAHKVDAVKWWNDGGRLFGAKSAEARAMMLNPDNYVLDHYSLNRSAGAILGRTTQYLPPGP